MMVSPVDCVTRTSKSNCSDFAVVSATDFAWSRAGTSSAGCVGSGCSLELAPHGLRAHSLRAMVSSGGSQSSILTAASGCNVSGYSENPPGLRPLPAPGKGLTIRLGDEATTNLTVYLTTANETWEETASALDKLEAAERESLEQYGDHAATVGAIRAAVMW